MTMAKKKTSVVLPGGIAGLVHNLQNGGSAMSEDRQTEYTQPDEQPARTVEAPAGNRSISQELDVQPVKSNDNQQSAQQARSTQTTVTADTLTVTDVNGETSEQYHIVKDNTDDSWKLFLDMAEKYKKAGGKLATIYIDPELKNVLDRLKYAGEERLPTAAILSSIVARFIYDHEDHIRKIIFGGKLI